MAMFTRQKVGSAVGPDGPGEPFRPAETDELKRLVAARRGKSSLFNGKLIRQASLDALKKLAPKTVARNPVMFVVYVGAIVTTLYLGKQFNGGGQFGFTLQIALWLWFTVIFANFAEAMAEVRGKAQADTLRATRKDTQARRIVGEWPEMVSSSELRQGDIVLVEEGETIPGDGEVVAGVAYVNEAAITGESAPVLKEPGTDVRSSVTGGTQVVSDRLRIRITANPGETFLDRMIALVEGAQRQKTPNEIALTALLAVFTIIFLI